jgi:hypothetical protein
MPQALVAGVPPLWSRQVRAALDKVQVEDWTLSVFPGINDKRPSLDLKQLAPLCEEAARRGGAHIIAVDEGRDRQAFAAAIREHFRFRWLSPAVVREATSALDPLVGEIARIVKAETAWREALHPVAKRSPLALPQRGFSASRPVAAMWSMCESFNKEPGFFNSVAAMLEQFKGVHLKKFDKHSQRFFVDDDSRVWKDEGTYHGDAPFPRDWKYSSPLPEGFHFDVQHAGGKAYEYVDRRGRKRSVAAGKHCNVDAHGHLRGQ